MQKPKLYYPGSESQNVQQYMRSLNQDKPSHRALELMQREKEIIREDELQIGSRSPRKTAKFADESPTFGLKGYSLDLRSQMQQGEALSGRCESSLVREQESRLDTQRELKVKKFRNERQPGRQFKPIVVDISLTEETSVPEYNAVQIQKTLPPPISLSLMESPDTKKKSIQALTPNFPKKIGTNFNQALSRSAQSKKNETGFYNQKKQFGAASEASESRLTSWIKDFTPIGKGSRSDNLIFACSCGMKEVREEGPIGCETAWKWIHLAFERNNKTFDYQKYKEQYETLASFDEESESSEQIDKDLLRTFPKSDYFKHQSSEGTLKLKRVLVAFSLYDRNIGYVQGMNFIVGSLLVHCNEQVAFWLFITLLQDYEVRENYEHGLPGLYKHFQIIDLLIMEQLPKIYQHFCEHGVIVELFASDWIFSLFTSVMPFEITALFLTEFFTSGWIFFYKCILQCLKHFEELLLHGDEIATILGPLKHWDQTGLPHNKVNKGGMLGKLDFFKKNRDPWKKILRAARQWKLNEDHIRHLLNNYDPKLKSFKFQPKKK